MQGEHEPTAVYGRADVAVLTAQQAASLDRRARETAGVPERVLMENAGRSAALILHHLHPTGAILGFAGSGNNGGDLLVVLRTLRNWGRECALVVAGAREPDFGLLHGTEIQRLGDHDLRRFDIIVDGLLGTGAEGAPRGEVHRAITAINDAGRPVVALDIPSGVDGSTGRVAGAAVRAATTVTFGPPKLGLMLQPGRAHAGRLLAVEIGFPPVEPGEAAGALITPEWVRARLPVRAPDAHKGTSGRLLIVGGRSGMAGAVAIAGEAAVRGGAGLVRLASVAANRVMLQSTVPEATFFERESLDAGACDGITAAVVGPGFGTDASAEADLERALGQTSGVSTLLDADALNLFASAPERLRTLAAERPLLITPHPRELARLLSCSVQEVIADVPLAARTAQERFGCVVLLKGQPTVIAAPDQPLLVNTVGSSDVAVGGMGDQLAGVIGALLAGGLAPRDAAGVGLFLSGRAADLAARGRSLSPRDVSANLAEAIRRPGQVTPPLPFPFITFDQGVRR